MIIFDPVLNTMLKRDPVVEHVFSGPRVVCVHCYRPIKGKVFYYDDKPLDEYCWQFRFILFDDEEEDEEMKELRKKALDKDRGIHNR